MTSKRAQNTLIEALAAQLRSCTSVSDGIAAPTAVIWADPQSQWRTLIPTLIRSIPELLVHGEYDPESRTGPAIWLRCMIDRTLDTPALPEDVTPIIYLPGIGRQVLRAGEDCPIELRPLVELMYRGTLWLQRGGHEWTATSFLASDDGLGLDLKGDTQTTEALLRALPEFATEPLSHYRRRRLEAEDFDQMLAPDVVRDLLLWMNDPDGSCEHMGSSRWEAFRNQCSQQFAFDPEADGEIVAGERLGNAEGSWANLWERFEEAPTNYPAIPDLLRRSKPSELIFEPTRWPDENDKAEEEVRDALKLLSDLSHADACAKLIELESKHGMRRAWVWYRLGQSPMAQVLSPLAEIANRVQSVVGGHSPDDIARHYIENGWQADRAAWQAVAMSGSADKELIRKVVQCLMEPWLDDSARVFQGAMHSSPLPDWKTAETVTAPEGGCLLFSDGLRYDLGEGLRERLEAQGCRVNIGYRWAALPTVTATAKPAITPVVEAIGGETLGADFTPKINESKKAVTAPLLRGEIEKQGYQILTGAMGDWPVSVSSRGWLEFGKIDTRGHELQDELPNILDNELDKLVSRITGLLDVGWQSVRVVTDHGWLFLPMGMPKVDLPKHLTASRWARCASISRNSVVDVPTAPWHWNSTQYFATGPGVSCFTASNFYAHGGLSIQECLTPDLIVERAGEKRARVAIDSVTWKGLRCFIVGTGTTTSIQVDLRLKSVSGESVVANLKAFDEEGATSLVLEDDDHESDDLVIVLLDESGTALAQQKTKVGNDL